MKKFKLLLSLSILFFAIYSCDQQSEFDSLESNELKRPITKPFETISTENDINYCGEPIECTLIAGQSIDAGTVTVSNNGTHLYVKVYSTAGFQDVDENIKMWIGTELPKKRPPAGHFPYKVTESGDTHIFQIELSSLLDVWDGECGEETKPLYIIVHADVLTEAGSAETAFGGCEEADTKGAWWYYMEYTTQCCEEKYAFIYKGVDYVTCFNEDGVFGWSNEHHYRYYRNGGTRINPIYFNFDNDCDIDNINGIGYADYSLLNPNTNNEEMNFHFTMKDGTENYEYEIYMGWNNPIENGELIDGIIFDKITPNALVFDFKKLVSSWQGTDPRIADPRLISNPLFYVIIKVKMIK